MDLKYRNGGSGMTSQGQDNKIVCVFTSRLQKYLMPLCQNIARGRKINFFMKFSVTIITHSCN